MRFLKCHVLKREVHDYSYPAVRMRQTEQSDIAPIGIQPQVLYCVPVSVEYSGECLVLVPEGDKTALKDPAAGICIFVYHDVADKAVTARQVVSHRLKLFHGRDIGVDDVFLHPAVKILSECRNNGKSCGAENRDGCKRRGYQPESAYPDAARPCSDRVLYRGKHFFLAKPGGGQGLLKCVSFLHCNILSQL